MNFPIRSICLGVSLFAVLAGAVAPAAAKHRVFCVPQGHKLSSACRSHGYVNGAPAHFKADRRAAYRSHSLHHHSMRQHSTGQ